MKKLLLSLLLGLILLSNIGFSEIFQYSVDAEIDENNTVSYKLSIIYVDNPKQQISFTLESPTDIRIETEATCKVVKKVLDTEVTCDMNASARTDINVLYTSDENVNNRDG